MATQNHAASVQGASIRVTRLDPAGNLLTGPNDSYTMSSFVRVTFTPEYEQGAEMTGAGADGTICVTYKAPDTMKRVTMELAICEPDPELSALASGGILLTKGGQSVGWATPQVGQDGAGDGVAVEVWSYAVAAGRKSAVNPYFHWIFPQVFLNQSGDRVIENGILATTFSGYGIGNSAFNQGPDGRWEWPAVADRPYAYARGAWAPRGYTGWYQWDTVTGAGTAVNTVTDPASGINEIIGGWDAGSGADNILDAANHS